MVRRLVAVVLAIVVVAAGCSPSSHEQAKWQQDFATFAQGLARSYPSTFALAIVDASGVQGTVMFFNTAPDLTLPHGVTVSTRTGEPSAFSLGEMRQTYQTKIDKLPTLKNALMYPSDDNSYGRLTVEFRPEIRRPARQQQLDEIATLLGNVPYIVTTGTDIYTPQ